MLNVIIPNQAWEKLLTHWRPKRPPTETVTLVDAVGRVLADDITAVDDLPGFDRSTVDGYAVRAADIFGASEGLPAYLNLVGQTRMGELAPRAIGPGETLAVPTGGALPPGADAVVMLEYTELLPGDLLGVSRPVATAENVVRRGEDIPAGTRLFAAGHTLRGPDIGALAGIGVTTVPVVGRPRVAIISTGDEVVAPQERPGPGQVRDINSYALAARVRECGGEPLLTGLVPDDRRSLLEAARRGLSEADLVVLSGGSSVGERDMAPEIIESLGQPGVLVHGLALKPGKPAIVGLVGEVPFFGLPGHPVSALVVFDLLVTRAINALLGATPRPTATIRARLSRSLSSGGGRDEYFRVRLERDAAGHWLAIPVLGKSGIITTLAWADGVICIPASREGLETGSEVEVTLL